MLAPRSGKRALGAIGKLLGRAAGEVQMDVRRLEQVVLDLIVVRQRADDVGVDVAFVVEGPQAAPHADVGVLDEARPVDAAGGGGGVGVGGGAVVRVGPRPRPQLDFEGAGAVVELVMGVGGLDGDVADLADEGKLRVSGGFWLAGMRGVGLGAGLGPKRGMADLGYFDAIDFELAVWVWLLRVDDLLDRDGSEGVFAVLWTMSAGL